MGKVVRVGSQVEGDIKLGDIVGVGAQADSCRGRNGDCEACADGEFSYCPDMRITYNSKHFNGDKTMGGHALYHRANSHFVIKVPDGLDPAFAAPMLCGGITVFSPLRNHGVGPGKTVGIIGVGGLGHFGVVFAKALGADKVVGISRSASKRDEVLQMGADDYIATNEGDEWKKTWANSLDVIVCTISSAKVNSHLLSVLLVVR